MAVTLVQLLQTLVKNNGSDLHLAASSPPMIRVRGEMERLNVPALTAADTQALFEQIANAQQKGALAAEKNIDFAFKAPGVGIFRVNVFHQRHGLSIVMRLLTENPPSIEELHLPEICKTACSYANGLVLVTGPTGSGKSTTLAAMINHINTTTKGHILTLEDPIEFQHESKMGMVSQRALGLHFTDFASAMKSALREDPDVILIGEMRDAETVAFAIKAAETGHLVFSTLHTNSAMKTIDRIINTFSAEEQPQIRLVLAETLKVVISQKLVPNIDGTTRLCFQDIYVNNYAAANLIRENKVSQLTTVMQTGRREGMQLLDAKLLEAVKAGEVSGPVAWEHANEKSAFSQWAPKPPGTDTPNQAATSNAGGTSSQPSGAQTAASGPSKKVA